MRLATVAATRPVSDRTTSSSGPAERTSRRATARGRSFDNRGEKNPKAKLTEHELGPSLSCMLLGHSGYRRLARKFGVGNTATKGLLEGGPGR